MQYGHDAAMVDGINGDFDIYRIRTEITERGATIRAGDAWVYVDERDKLTRAERLMLLTEDLTYTAKELDRDVVSESQIRTVLRQFRERVSAGGVPWAYRPGAEMLRTVAALSCLSRFATPRPTPRMCVGWCDTVEDLVQTSCVYLFDKKQWFTLFLWALLRR